jgi:hypothetical protein
MLLAVIVHPASVQDRDGAEPLLRQARRLFPLSSASSATPAMEGRRWPLPWRAPARGRWRSSAAATGTASWCLPKRWIVERTIGWISRNRRLVPRLRAPLPHRRRLRPHGHDPHHAAQAGRKALSVNLNFSDGL